MFEEVKEALYQHYNIEEEDGEEERGCYINGEWLSISEILNILKYYL